jgi:uncharacterized protein YdeI (YjbR/CyaY-like superfamily)
MKANKSAENDIPTLLFPRQKGWEEWLRKNHAKSSGAWLRLAKKTSGMHSVSYTEALETALRYGWIDGQKRSHDESWWLQKFTPRGAKSIWSKINKGKAEDLIKNGHMTPAGLQAVGRAKQDGRWDAAYDSPSSANVPTDFQARLRKSAKAKAFFATLDRANRYAILFRIQTAKKAETRARRIGQFIEMLERKEKLH